MKEIDPSLASEWDKLYGDQVRIFQERGLEGHEFALTDGPFLLEDFIDNKVWRKRWVPQTNKLVEFEDFREFAVAEVPEGLNSSKKSYREMRQALIDLCHGNNTIQTKIRQQWPMTGDELANTPGAPTKEKQEDNLRGSKIITKSPESEYFEARLAKKHPEIYKRVLSGELKPNTAMKEAGLRRRYFKITTDPEQAARAIKNRYDDVQIEKLIHLLREA